MESQYIIKEMLKKVNLSTVEELDILSCLANGKSRVSIMKLLDLPESFVSSTISAICEKTGCENTNQLLYHIKNLEMEYDLAIRYMEIFDTCIQNRFSKVANYAVAS